jgi:hypothetical protein
MSETIKINYSQIKGAAETLTAFVATLDGRMEEIEATRNEFTLKMKGAAIDGMSQYVDGPLYRAYRLAKEKSETIRDDIQGYYDLQYPLITPVSSDVAVVVNSESIYTQISRMKDAVLDAFEPPSIPEVTTPYYKPAWADANGVLHQSRDYDRENIEHGNGAKVEELRAASEQCKQECIELMDKIVAIYNSNVVPFVDNDAGYLEGGVTAGVPMTTASQDDDVEYTRSLLIPDGDIESVDWELLQTMMSKNPDELSAAQKAAIESVMVAYWMGTNVISMPPAVPIDWKALEGFDAEERTRMLKYNQAAPTSFGQGEDAPSIKGDDSEWKVTANAFNLEAATSKGNYIGTDAVGIPKSGHVNAYLVGVSGADTTGFAQGSAALYAVGAQASYDVQKISITNDTFNAYAKGEASAYLVRGEAKGAINIFGLKIGVAAEGYAGAVGVTGTAVFDSTKGKFELEAGAALAVGGSVRLTVSW